MAAQKELALREMSRRHLKSFIPYNYKKYKASWHHDIITDKLEMVEEGKLLRLMLFLPPRHGKSEIGSIQFPAWFIGRNPEKEIICCSYTSDLAVDFGRKTRNLIDSPEYQNVFDVKLAPDSKAANKWRTNKGGSYTAVGVGGPITGRGADILIIDDPFKNRKEAESPLIRQQVWNWYLSTAYTRLSPGGAVIVIQTRWHMDDLSGKLIEQAKKDGDSWNVVKFPAIAIQDEVIDDKVIRKTGDALWPTRFPVERLMQIKSVLGNYDWASLYQQEPIDEDSIEFKRDWFKYRSEEDVQRLNTRRFLTIDTAGRMTTKSDYMGFTDNRVDREGNWNIKAWKVKMNSAELLETLFTLQDIHHFESIGIEKTIYLDAIQKFMEIEMQKRKKILPIKELEHRNQSKELRIRGLVPRYQAGNMFHVTGQTSDLEKQLLQFPKGAEDDIIDSLAYQDQIAEAPFYNDPQEMEAQDNNFDKFSPLGDF